jgi:hypothetical protein
VTAQQLSVRLDPEVIARAEALVERLAADPLTSSISRADVLRAALLEGLAVLEQKHGGAKTRRKRR